MKLWSIHLGPDRRPACPRISLSCCLHNLQSLVETNISEAFDGRLILFLITVALAMWALFKDRNYIRFIIRWSNTLSCSNSPEQPYQLCYHEFATIFKMRWVQVVWVWWFITSQKLKFSTDFSVWWVSHYWPGRTRQSDQSCWRDKLAKLILEKISPLSKTVLNVGD